MEGFSPSVQKSTLFGAPFFLDVYTFSIFAFISQLLNYVIKEYRNGFDHNMIVWFIQLSTFMIYRSPLRN